jgi:hypothetical protein
MIMEMKQEGTDLRTLRTFGYPSNQHIFHKSAQPLFVSAQFCCLHETIGFSPSINCALGTSVGLWYIANVANRKKAAA